MDKAGWEVSDPVGSDDGAAVRLLRQPCQGHGRVQLNGLRVQVRRQGSGKTWEASMQGCSLRNADGQKSCTWLSAVFHDVPKKMD